MHLLRRQATEMGFNPACMGVGNDDLPISRFAHHFYQSLRPVFVDFFENVIEEQDGIGVCD